MGQPADAFNDGDLQQILGYQAARAALALRWAYEESGEVVSGLHRIEYTVLMLVKANPDCTAAVLARWLGISSPNMVLWLDRLAEKKLLSRRQSLSDRRAKRLQLTRQGAELAGRATAAIIEAENQLLADLSSGERMLLAELLGKVARRGLR